MAKSKDIRELFGLVPVKEFKEKSTGEKCQLFGLELEIEELNPTVDKSWYLVNGINYHDDGSLRGRAGEYVTQPMRREILEEVLRAFFEKGNFSEKNYSERTSVHVHANVQDCSIEQVNAVFLLYEVFEEILFSWIGDDRRSNIFCVPWSDTTIAANHIFPDGGQDPSKVYRNWKNWEKYTALNILPITTLGTIEFRHMAGTCDLARILMWCDIIGSIISYAKRVPFNTIKSRLMEMNTVSDHGVFLTEVFFGIPGFLKFAWKDSNREYLSAGIRRVKYSLLNAIEDSLYEQCVQEIYPPTKAPMPKVTTKKLLWDNLSMADNQEAFIAHIQAVANSVTIPPPPGAHGLNALTLDDLNSDSSF